MKLLVIIYVSLVALVFMVSPATYEEKYTVTLGGEIETDIYMSAPVGLFGTGFLIL